MFWFRMPTGTPPFESEYAPGAISEDSFEGTGISSPDPLAGVSVKPPAGCISSSGGGVDSFFILSAMMSTRQRKWAVPREPI